MTEAEIKNELSRITEEISAYPAPIAGCDAQFNALLERRDELTEMLQRRQTDSGA